MHAAGLHQFLQVDLADPLVFPFCGGRAAVYTRRSPARDRPNQDSVLLLQVDDEAGVLAVADGAGGQSSGGRASAIAVECVRHEVHQEERTIREGVLTAFENGNRDIADLKVGAASTLAVVEVGPESLRSYHVGDSGVLLVGQRGKRKFASIAHSPVSYAVEAGLLNEDDALHHEERHVVSNVLGGEGMRMEVSGRIGMRGRDTLLVASDGVYDNLHIDEIVELIRTGPIGKAAARLVNRVRARMRGGSSQPSKPDDVTFVLFRRS